MIPQKLSLTPFTEGDEWEGIPAIVITETPEGGSPAPPASALAKVTMRFKKSGDVPSAVVELSSDVEGEITITSAANWEFTIPPQVVAGLTTGKWDWRIRCEDSTDDGAPKTYLADQLTVLETV